MFATRSGYQSIFASRVVRELRVEPPTVADGVPLPPAVPIVEPSKSRKVVYLPGERLLKKLNKDRDCAKARQSKKKRGLGEDDCAKARRLESSVRSVLASLDIQ